MEAQARALGEGEESARLTLPAMTLGGKHDSENRTAGTDGRARALLLAPGPAGFGGPVALVSQMERELVAEKGCLTSEQMREAIAICQSLPGPLAIQVGI